VGRHVNGMVNYRWFLRVYRLLRTEGFSAGSFVPFLADHALHTRPSASVVTSEMLRTALRRQHGHHERPHFSEACQQVRRPARHPCLRLRVARRVGGRGLLGCHHRRREELQRRRGAASPQRVPVGRRRVEGILAIPCELLS
jgi:hypothetical protein